jgi:hypothetical protein
VLSKGDLEFSLQVPVKPVNGELCGILEPSLENSAPGINALPARHMPKSTGLAICRQAREMRTWPSSDQPHVAGNPRANRTPRSIHSPSNSSYRHPRARPVPTV